MSYTATQDLYYNPYVDELEAINNRPYGTNEKYVLQGEVLFGTGYIIEIPDNITLDEPLVIEYSVTDQHVSLIDHTFIKIGKSFIIIVGLYLFIMPYNIYLEYSQAISRKIYPWLGCTK